MFLIFFSHCSLNSGIVYKKEILPKNLILMIGDGMGPGQISLLYYFLKYSKKFNISKVENGFERMGKGSSIGMSTTEPYGNIVADSASSATQLAIGQPARPETIGLDIDGGSVLTILEKAQKRGMLTGLVTDTRMTHATPAAFAAHVKNRRREDDIAEAYMETAPDILLSGGANRFIPKGQNINISPYFTIKSRRKDDKNLLEKAIKRGYRIVYSKSELEMVDSNKKILGFFTNHSMPNALWFHRNKNNSKRTIPNLLEMSKSAIKHLSYNSSGKGFFLMIEGGQIDWAAHQNDAGTMLHEMLSFNETLNWVIDWVKKNPNTLLVVTGDHETGGFGFSNNIIGLKKIKKNLKKVFSRILIMDIIKH